MRFLKGWRWGGVLGSGAGRFLGKGAGRYLEEGGAFTRGGVDGFTILGITCLRRHDEYTRPAEISPVPKMMKNDQICTSSS